MHDPTGQPGASSIRTWNIRILLLLLVAAFVAAQWPLARVLQFHHPDERHYTDAALLMLSTGDYWTPRRHDGVPRPQKPLGTYWATAGAFRVFGVSPIASRLPPLACGGALLLLTFALARRTTGRAEAGLLAAAILASQPTFLLCSNRTTPDIFLTVGLTLGFLGLVRLLKAPRLDAGGGLLVLGGATLAVLAKGLLGLVFLAFALAVCFKTHREALRRHRVLLGCLLLGWCAVSVAWFVSMARLHGAGFLAGFVYDQILGRFLIDRWWHKPLNVIGYGALHLLMFLPWWLVLLRGRGGARNLRLGDTPRAVARAFIAWALLCALIFGLGNKLTGRYILSAAPLWATLLADLYMRVVPSRRASAPERFRHLAFACAGVAALALLAVPWTGGLSRELAVPATGLLGVLGLVLTIARAAPGSVSAPVRWSALALSIPPFLALLFRQPFEHSLEPRLAGLLQELERDASNPLVVLCSEKPGVLARARLHLGHPLPTVSISDLGTNTVPPEVNVLVVADLASEPPGFEAFVPYRTVQLPAASWKKVPADGKLRCRPFFPGLLQTLREGYPLVPHQIAFRGSKQAP